MSLNRYEQTVFDYLGREPEERRYWQAKVAEAAGQQRAAGEVSRGVERELWRYFEERAQHTPVFRQLVGGDGRRVSLQNLAEHLIRLWGPPPKEQRPGSTKG